MRVSPYPDVFPSHNVHVLDAGKLFFFSVQILNLTTLALSIARATRSDSICISVGVMKCQQPISVIVEFN